MARLSAGRATALAAAALLALYAALTAATALKLGPTADERLLWMSGGAAVRGNFAVVETTFQGPLPLYANQLLARAPEAVVDEGGPVFTPSERARARLGMLPFGLLAGWLVFRRARLAFGDAGGLLALATFALHPLMWGYGALVAVDMAHTALVLLALEAVLAHAARPTLGRAALAGAALGLALAAKYLALLVAPVGLVFVAAHAARGARERGGAAWRAGAGALLAGALALLAALHAAYLFRGGFGAAPETYESPLLRGALGAPLLGRALHFLPGPLLQGLDYQLVMGASVSDSYFHGAYAAGHPLYFLAGLALKTPEAILLAWVLALALGLPRWLGPRAARPLRDAARLCLAAALVPFLYLSLVAKLQVGIRYVLPAVPLLCIAAGGLPLLPPLARLGRGARRALAGTYGLLLLVPALCAWPYGPGFFNALGGGPAAAHRWFNDSSADWGERRAAGLDALRARHPGLTEVLRVEGPRLGTVASYVRNRSPRDPEDAARARHWLDALASTDHEGAAWLAYDASPEAWRAAAERDPRARADLSLALLGAGRLAEARAELSALAAVAPERAAPLRDLLARLESAPPGPGGATLAACWLTAGRPDLAAAALPPELAAQGDAEALLRAQALVRLERLDEAALALEARDRAPGADPDGVLLLAELYRRSRRWEDGVALLERHLPALSGAERAQAGAALERLRKDRDRWQTFLSSL